MRYFALLIAILSFNTFASEVFRIEFQKKTKNYEEYRLTTRKSRSFVLTKTSKGRVQKAELSYKTGLRLSEILTKLSFTPDTTPQCTEYFTYYLDAEKGRVCEEEREKTKDAIQLMYHLDTFF